MLFLYKLSKQRCDIPMGSNNGFDYAIEPPPPTPNPYYRTTLETIVLAGTCLY